LDTTIRDPDDPSVMLRVDVSPHAPASLEANAAPVLSALRRQAGYRELALRPTTFAGFDALFWEFLDVESGVQMHKIDVFFVDQAGRGFGVLTQAPASQWPAWAATFAAARSSLIPNGD